MTSYKAITDRDLNPSANRRYARFGKAGSGRPLAPVTGVSVTDAFEHADGLGQFVADGATGGRPSGHCADQVLE
jgi:hypothetical protein